MLGSDPRTVAHRTSLLARVRKPHPPYQPRVNRPGAHSGVDEAVGNLAGLGSRGGLGRRPSRPSRSGQSWSCSPAPATFARSGAVRTPCAVGVNWNGEVATVAMRCCCPDIAQMRQEGYASS